MRSDGRRDGAPSALVASGDAEVRRVVHALLASEGYVVSAAPDAKSARARIDGAQLDLAVLDEGLGDEAVADACRRLRARRERFHVPVVILTPDASDGSIERAYEHGADDFVTRPLEPSLLRHRVRYLRRTCRTIDALIESERRLSAAHRIARLGTWDWQLASDRVHCSREMAGLFGLPPEAVATGLPVRRLLGLVHRGDRDEVVAALRVALARRSPLDVQHRVCLPDGSVRTVRNQAEVVGGAGGRPVRLHGTVQDVTDRRREQETIRFLAQHDALTGLPNRDAFKARLASAINLAERRRRLVATLILDLDNFKRINDTLSHAGGDRLLETVAARLRSTLRASDSIGRGPDEALGGDVARLGGDEFIVLLSEIRRFEDASIVARRILRSLSQPLVVSGHEVIVTPSVGIAIYPNDGDNPDDLLRNADAAMYHAKEEGKNRFKFYSEEMNASSLERLALESKLRKAIDRDELVLHFQPQLDLASGAIVGVEALVRWNHPELGLVPPATFIPLAEETGLIVRLGEWVLEQACAAGRDWSEAGLPPIRVGVNLSGMQVRQPDFVASILGPVGRSGLDPARLELELTESTVMADPHETAAALGELKAAGIGLSIDDFGTGFSSLSYLKRFPIDRIKVDRTFIRDVASDPDDASITKAIIAMGHSLGMRVVAEGVEREEQLAFLRAQSCDEVQGFLIGRPAPADDLVPRLEGAGVPAGAR